MDETLDDGTGAAGDVGDLDPREAASLLEQAFRQAQRRFETDPPLLSLLGAAVVLVVYGAVWLSVRGQQPYTGPNGAALAVVYTAVFAIVGVSVSIRKRATAGIGGRALRQQRATGAAMAAAYVGVYAFMGALYHAGASHAIVYGLYPAAAPLIVLGSAAAAYSAARENWLTLGLAIAVVAVASASAFAGPIGVWAFTGVGLGIVALGHAAVQVWLRRARG